MYDDSLRTRYALCDTQQYQLRLTATALAFVTRVEREEGLGVGGVGGGVGGMER